MGFAVFHHHIVRAVRRFGLHAQFQHTGELRDMHCELKGKNLDALLRTIGEQAKIEPRLRISIEHQADEYILSMHTYPESEPTIMT
jgi:hypothetical protein